MANKTTFESLMEDQIKQYEKNTQQIYDSYLNDQLQQLAQRQAQIAQGGAGGGGLAAQLGGGAGGYYSSSPFQPASTQHYPNKGGTTMSAAQDEKKKIFKMKELTIEEAKRALNKILKTPIVPFLWGPPGIGKSSLVRELCKENNWDLIDLRLSLLNPVDLRGLPMIDKEHQKARWLAPSFLPNGANVNPGILFLDEINLAPLSVQAAAYQLILDKKVGEYVFPDHWKIIAAGNRETDRANVYKISAPLANRFVHFTLRPDINAWRAWANGRVHTAVIDFLYMRQSIMLQMPNDSEKAFPSPRSWDFVSQILTAFEYDESKDLSEELKQAIIGSVGEGAAKEFLAFLTDYKVKEVARSVEEFVKTGTLNMPKTLNLRFQFVIAIYHAYRAGRVTETKYQIFLDKLTSEEKAVLKEFEEENKEVLDEKYAVPKPDLQKPFGTLAEALGHKDGVTVSIEKGGNITGAINMLFDTSGNVEVVEISRVGGDNFEITARGLRKTTARSWSAGAYVQTI